MDGAQIYSVEFPGEYRDLNDMIYFPPLDCYLLACYDKIYRKDIDGQHPYLYMELKCGTREGAHFRYSNIHQRLVIAKDCLKISVLSPETKEVEIEVQKNLEGLIQDFRLFGEQEDRVVAITATGFVLLFSLDYTRGLWSPSAK